MSDETARKGFDSIAKSLLSHIKDGHVLQLRLGEGAACVASMPLGKCPASIRVDGGGKVNLVGFDDAAVPRDIQEQIRESNFLTYEGYHLKAFLGILVVKGGAKQHASIESRVAGQILWQVCQVVERKCCAGVTRLRFGCTRRQLRKTLSDASAASATSVKPAKVAMITNTKNPRHMIRELWRYQQACKETMAEPMFLSVGGPDGTKVGTDLSLQVAVVYHVDSGRAAIAPPQA